MNTWFAPGNDITTIPEQIIDSFDADITKVFYKDSPNRFQNKKVEVHFVRKTSKHIGISLGEPIASSLFLAEEILEQCETSEPPSLIITELNEGYAYFLLQNLYTCHPKLKNIPVLLLANSTTLEADQEDSYRFPNYWIREMEKFCLRAADYVFVNNTSISNIIKPFVEESKLHYISDIPHKKGLIENCIPFEKGNIRSFPVPEYVTGHLKKENSQDNEHESFLSIIIPFYNLGKYLLETIESIRKNQYSSYEIIVVNDGSDDEQSINLLNELKDSNDPIQIINIENKGLANARNIGARAAKGKYITFLDADDLIAPDYYIRCINVLNTYKNVSFVYSWVKYFGKRNDVWVTFNTHLPYLLLTNMLAAFPVIRHEDFLQFGLNKLDMDKGMEDYESWISMCEAGCFGVSIPSPLVHYRIRSESMSRQFNRTVVIELYRRIANKHTDLYRLYGVEIFNLISANGPGYLWNNPTLSYPSLGFNHEDDTLNSADSNNMKYELLRIFNSSLGKRLLKIFFKIKLHKLFK